MGDDDNLIPVEALFARRHPTTAPAPRSAPKKAAPPVPMLESLWGRTAASFGFTPVCNLLLEHQGILGLSHAELVVVLNLEMHRFAPDAPVIPSAATIARRCGKSEDSIRATLRSLRRKGLIETDERFRQTGDCRQTTNHHSAHGLRELLALVAVNLEAGRPPDHGLEQARAELARHAGSKAA